jgi:hypothetical protein
MLSLKQTALIHLYFFRNRRQVKLENGVLHFWLYLRQRWQHVFFQKALPK